MHELGITRNIVAIVSEHADEKMVKKVVVEIGKLSAILPDAIQFCFDICCKDTLLENATLEINVISGLGACNACGIEFEMTDLLSRCDCGGRDITCIAGEEMKIKEMEVYP